MTQACWMTFSSAKMGVFVAIPRAMASEGLASMWARWPSGRAIESWAMKAPPLRSVMVMASRVAPSSVMVLARRSWVIGRGRSMPSRRRPMAAASTMPMTMGNERGESRFGSSSRSSMSCSGLRSLMSILESSIWTSMGDCRGGLGVGGWGKNKLVDFARGFGEVHRGRAFQIWSWWGLVMAALAEGSEECADIEEIKVAFACEVCGAGGVGV